MNMPPLREAMVRQWRLLNGVASSMSASWLNGDERSLRAATVTTPHVEIETIGRRRAPGAHDRDPEPSTAALKPLQRLEITVRCEAGWRHGAGFGSEGLNA